MTDHAPLTIAGLADTYRQPDGPSPRDVVDDVLARVAANEGRVQAMVTVTDDLARYQAEQAARRLRDGDPSPLLGVPIVLKDLVDVAGVPTTAGSAVLRSNVPTENAQVWSRLEAAGAVLVGKANTHEFAYGGTTEPTRNPWDLSRMVGGSSGGPAAALAAGFCAAAIGTDTAGSIRIPAALCGVTGLKTTQARYATDGIIPLAPSLDVVGPMAHTPRDCELLVAALDGVSSRFDAMVEATEAALDRRAVRVGVLDPGQCDPEVRARLGRVVQQLEFAGARCDHIGLPGLDQALASNFTILGAEAVDYHRRFDHRREDYSPYVRQRLDEAAATPPDVVVAARAHREALRTAVEAALADVDVLVGPGVPVVAPPAYVAEVPVDGVPQDRDSMFCTNYAFANLTGHPALSTPMGLVDGLPVGLHLVGRACADEELLALGDVVSRLVGWEPTLAPI